MGTVLSDTMLRTLSIVSLAAFIAVCSGSNQNAYGRLWDDLFDDKSYNPEIIPVEGIPQDNKDNAINLGIGLSLRRMDMDEAGNVLGQAWFKAMWKDFRLMWDPAQYEGIQQMRVPGSKIWKPDFSFYNQIEYRLDDADNQLKDSPYNAVVMSTGQVIWIPPVSFEVDCSSFDDNEFYIPTMKDPKAPVDCKIKIGSWTYDGYHINITSFNLMGKDDGPKMELNDFSPNSPFLVVSQEEDSAIHSKFYDCCPEPYMSVVFKFKVQRAYNLATDEDGNDVKDYYIEPEKIKEILKNGRTSNDYL